MPIAIMIVWLTPSIVVGFPIGSWTLRSSWPRVAPIEVEECLMQHAAVSLAATQPRVPSEPSTSGGSG